MRLAFMQEGIAAIVFPTNKDVTLQELLKPIPEGSSYIILEDDYEFPPYANYFRNAWKINFDTNHIEIDFEKAKELTIQRLREEREPLLAKLDVAFQRALETNSDTTAIVAEKQRLRDITSLVDNLTTIEDLKDLKC